MIKLSKLYGESDYHFSTEGAIGGAAARSAGCRIAAKERIAELSREYL